MPDSTRATPHCRRLHPGRTVNLPVESLLALDRATVHDVKALEESAILLTTAWPEETSI